MQRWIVLSVLLPLLGGMLACAGVIIRKAPSSRAIFNRLLPYKALVGVALLGSFFVNWQDMGWNPFKGFGQSSLFGSMTLMNLVAQLVLGFTMGFGQIAKWIPGDTEPEERAEALQRKLIPYELVLGLVAIASGILGLVFALNQELFY